jgi:hypothetical protein
MQNNHEHFKICTPLQNLSNMQKYAHSNFRYDVRETNTFRTLLYLTTIKKNMQMLVEVPKLIYEIPRVRVHSQMVNRTRASGPHTSYIFDFSNVPKHPK